MPRNSQGLYTLPPSNPVAPNTLIESAWANTTMEDIGAALTGSLPRDGSAPMTGALILKTGQPTQPREAVSKAYMEQFLAYATGMPVGAVFAFASGATPPGYLLCNGQAVSRTTYNTLFVAIGTVYGSGDGSTTFNVPDLRNEFVRGKADARALGNKQTAAFASHNHGVADPGHVHAGFGSQNPHSHIVTTGSHSHTVTDPTHTHGGQVGTGSGAGAAGGSGITQGGISAAATGISIDTAGNIGGFTDTQTPTVFVSVGTATTGVSTGVAGSDETRPQNIALDYYIKATNDTALISGITSITSSDDQMISIDNTNPVSPELVINSNVAFGTVKLDASGQIPLGLLSSSTQQLLGYWNASGGETPSEASPSTNFSSGDTFIISVTGTLTVYNPVTLVASPTVVAVGSMLQYIENSLTNPTGWYYVVASTTVVASQVGLAPVGSIAATNVQAGFAEVDGDLNALYAAVAAAGTPAASAVSFSPTGTIAAANVQAAITELDIETQTALAGKAPASAATASGTSFTPAGNIFTDNVQLAIEDLDADLTALEQVVNNQSLFASVVFVGNGANGPCTIGSSNGVANVTKTGTGTYDIYFTDAQPDVEYVISAVCDANGPGLLALPFITNSTTSKATVISYNLTPVAADATRMHVMFNRPNS